MASDERAALDPAVLRLLEEKLNLMNEVFTATQEELLLVDLDKLTPLLERKERLFGKISAIDGQLEAEAAEPQLLAEAPQIREIAEVVEAILENESTLETRMREEQVRLRAELREFDQQTRLKQYLERRKRKESRIDLKK